MPSSTLHHGSFDWGPRLGALWAGVLAGPVCWAALLEVNYTLSYVACEVRHTWMLHLAVLVALIAVWGSAYAAYLAAPPPGSDELPSSQPEEIAIARARFMTYGGMALCAFFTLVILAQEVPILLLSPCAW